MKKLFLVLLIFPILIVSGCHKENKVELPANKDSNFIMSDTYGNYNVQEKKLYQFFEKKMVTNKGIYTNYLNITSKNQGTAVGHDMLSESSGFWLEYLVYEHKYKEFREFYKVTKKTFDQGSQFSYLYNPQNNKKSNVNATLDDLRIIRSLQMYYEATGNSKYRYEAAKRFTMLKSNVIKKGRLTDFYDVKAKRASSDSSLAYYDFLTLKYFESDSKQDKKYYQNQVKMVQRGYLGDAFPLYASSYSWQSGAYSDKDLNTSEALETILHLSEVGKCKKVTLNWLARQVKEHKLYNSYSIDGAAIDKNQSSGSYALAAMIFAKNKDEKMYHYTMNVMWRSQVEDKSSPIYGALGIKRQKQAYSFNNLLGLVSSKY
ncbi:hypothetical protein [Companilactobacillus nuruki]|uniref:Glycosyl hydrolase family 8 n=1 Tax=Companilactobacillus nuruki TaxID=1993540 RepID=A0A2N7AUB2_9LACO|nr:hypothetical protein [Companilactobacillus nuruki]PMD70675.1 hypothetical protein CBP76_06370 [Companilactobacillus nuruki]